MGLRQSAEQRWFPRYHAVSRQFEGHLSVAPGGPALEARVVDVSRDGIGAVLAAPVRDGETVHLAFAERTIPLVVVYCIPDLIHQGQYRCGLQRRGGGNENLVSLFAANGMLAER